MRIVFLCLAWILIPTLWATGDNPFFSGDNVTVDIQPERIVLGNSVYQRTISANLQTTSLLVNGVETLSAPSTEAFIYTADAGIDASEATIVGIGVVDAPDSKIVRIHATSQDIPFTLCYRVFKGNRPYMAKWIEFPASTYVVSVSLEWLMLKSQYCQAAYGEWGTSGIVASGNGIAFGLQVDEMRPVSNCYRHVEGLKADLEVLRETTGTQPCVLAMCGGTRYSAAFALQLYWGSYITHASSQNRPVVYNGWYAYKWYVTDTDCYRSIPIAAKLGADYYVVDDGWQNRYGEWLVNGTQFPTGLVGVANAVRAAGMKFGFWLAPAITKPEATNLNIDWLIKGFDHEVWTGSGWPVYCFSTAWSDWIAARTKDLVHQTGAEFLKLDFTVQYPYCFDQSHGHGDRRAQPPQTENWKRFLDTMRAEQPNMQIFRSGTAAESSSYNDFGWYSDWILAGLSDPRRKDARWWFRSADSTRYGTGGARYLTPQWCLSGTTPGHIYTLEHRYDVLEYNITSVLGQYCNLEFSNRLEEITWDEMATCQKWVRWYRKNQPYLAFGQFDDVARRAYNAFDSSLYGAEYVDGAYHLRPLLDGRYGYLCFWNPSESAKTVSVNIKPADYFLPAALGMARLHALNAGWSALSAGPNLSAQFTMAPLSWEIVEVTDPSVATQVEITLRGTASFEGLPNMTIGQRELTFTITDSTGVASEQSVPVGGDGAFRMDVDLPPGPFRISAKPGTWLRRSLDLVNSGNNLSGLQVTFVNGDIIGDNVVDIADLVSVLVDFELEESPADLDWSGLVDIHDLVIVLLNFGLPGND